jgi:hypothetical protein
MILWDFLVSSGANAPAGEVKLCLPPRDVNIGARVPMVMGALGFMLFFLELGPGSVAGTFLAPCGAHAPVAGRPLCLCYGAHAPAGPVHQLPASDIEFHDSEKSPEIVPCDIGLFQNSHLLILGAHALASLVHLPICPWLT